MSIPMPPGFVWRPESGDENIVKAAWWYNEYRLPELLHSDDVVIDVGAHIGGFAYAAWQQGSRRVWAYEASPENFGYLWYNLGERPGVVCRWAAVWRSDREDDLVFAPSSDPANTGGGGVLGDMGRVVPSISFDDVIARATAHLPSRRVRLVKLDCEGSEWPILFTSQMLQHVDEIAGEYHQLDDPPEIARVTGFNPPYDIPLLQDHLHRQGFAEVGWTIAVPGMGLFWARRV